METFNIHSAALQGSIPTKTLKERKQEQKEERFAVMHKALMDSISATCTTLMRNHTERMRRQNELFLEEMRTL